MPMHLFFARWRIAQQQSFSIAGEWLRLAEEVTKQELRRLPDSIWAFTLG